MKTLDKEWKDWILNRSFVDLRENRWVLGEVLGRRELGRREFVSKEKKLEKKSLLRKQGDDL
ncbi:MAG: hypothetical protein JNN23_15130 [Chryseobacterium gambrini]|nr:hypothetical protein [Chryseobacterium gambrini]